MMTLRISTQAEMDIAQAAAYYADISLDTLSEFETALNRAIQSLLQFWKFQIKYGRYRTYRVKPFPYSIHYQVENEVLTVEALFHERADKVV